MQKGAKTMPKEEQHRYKNDAKIECPERVEKTTDIVSVGDEVRVKLIGVDDRGKVKLSMKSVNQETGEEITN